MEEFVANEPLATVAYVTTTPQVNPPPINLAMHYFEAVEVKLNPKFTPQTEQVTFQTTIWSSLYKNPEDEANFILKMLIKIPFPENNNVPVSGSFLIVGAFMVDKDYGKSEQEKAMLVKATGGGMLYGAAREFVLHITARCNWDNRPLYLPTFPMDAIANCAPIEALSSQTEGEKVSQKSSES